MDINRICIGCMRELPYEQMEGKCPYCDCQVNLEEKQPYHHLRPTSILAGKYLVGRVLGEGGFGITYIGLDLNLGDKVAIKEFFPNGYVTRDGARTSWITDYEGSNWQMVQKWKKSFLKEAQALAKCTELSGVVGVKEFFQENNSAYIIMEYLEGENLKSYLQRNGRLPVDEVLKLMQPVIISLEQIHGQGLIHRDISPDNLMLMPTGNVKLLDFGAAREYAAEDEKSLSVMLKPGYAPEEQYRTKGKQGPWSDVYALCATIYKCITGITPPEAMERMRKDELILPSRMGIFIPQPIEAALQKGMAVYAEYRIQGMYELYELLYAQDFSTVKIEGQEAKPDKPESDKTEPDNEERTNVEAQKMEPVDTKPSSEQAGETDGHKTVYVFGKSWKKKAVIIVGVIAIAITIVIALCTGMGYFILRNIGDKEAVEEAIKITLTEEEAEEAYTFYGDLIAHMVEDNSLPYIVGDVFDQELYQQGIFPDIYAAIQDVDQDGMKELVLRMEGTLEEKQERQIVYKYDIQTRNVFLEMDCGAIGDFYKNGIFVSKEDTNGEIVVMRYSADTGTYAVLDKGAEAGDISQYTEGAASIKIAYSKVTIQ